MCLASPQTSFLRSSSGPSRPRPVRPSAFPSMPVSSAPPSGRTASRRCIRSRARHPHRTRPPPRPASASLRLLGHWETRCRPAQSHRTHPAVNETPSNQGLATTYARTSVPIRPTEARSEVEINVKTFYLEAAAAAAAGCDERQRIRPVTDVCGKG